MPIKRASIIFCDSSSHTQPYQPNSPPVDESTLLKEIISKSRLGAHEYLQTIKAHLRQPGTFLDFLKTVKDLRDELIDPPNFILKIAKLTRYTSELVSNSVLLLPPGYRLGLEKQGNAESFVVTMRTPIGTAPIRIVCKESTNAGFFGHPGPSSKSSNSPSIVKSSLKRKHSMSMRPSSIVHSEEDLSQDPSLLTVPTRHSKRLRLRRESAESTLSSQSRSSMASRSHEKPITAAGVIQLFLQTLSSREKNRRLMKYRGEKAQLVLDILQALLDVPDLVPKSRQKLKRALIRLSMESSLPPSCFSLSNLNMDDLSPSDEPDGNFGEIYSGRFHKQPLCIKIVKLRRKSNMDKVSKAFLKEGVIWGQINHPNILPFYGIYRLQDRYNRLSLVSPWLANGNVNSYLENHPEANRLLLAFDIIQGIAYLHKEGFVHGDLKGPNILVTKTGRACLADFGLAIMDYEEAPNWTSLRSTEATGGTLRWQAPELLEDETKPTMEGDIYSFGCILYEVFTGHVPYYEISQQIRVIKEVLIDNKRPTRPPSTHDAWTMWGLTEEIWSLMERCWERDGKKRPLADKIAKNIPKLGAAGMLEDTRATTNDEYLSPSAFRHAVHARLNPMSEESIAKVVQWLHE